MSMLDAFFSKGAFKAPKCKTLLKLTIPRIKLLRNRRELQLKQMRKDIAKLLETGQEATARIRVEHIIREENMMAAQEILELFCELIAVRLPIIEIQRECPLDLKEAISSVCFAAPRCSDLPELQQVQIQFAAKYGKEFVTAAAELLPDCGVNRQIIELLSVRAPSVEVKMKLLKEIAEEYELDWDPAATEMELNKPHEDLLNGPAHFISGSTLPLPKEKHEDLPSTTNKVVHEKAEPEPEHQLDSDFDLLDFPEVPKVSVSPSPAYAPTPDAIIPGTAPPLPTSPDTSLESKLETAKSVPHLEPDLGSDIVTPVLGSASTKEQPTSAVDSRETKEFVSIVSPASPPIISSSVISPEPVHTPAESFPSVSDKTCDMKIDLDDVLAAAHNAAETAERAAAAARAAATLAQVRIAELVTKRNEQVSENGSVVERGDSVNPNDMEKKTFHQYLPHEDSTKNIPTETPKLEMESPRTFNYQSAMQPSRSTSLEDDPYFSYPNLFGRQDSHLGK